MTDEQKLSRVFKTGSTRIVETDSMRGKTVDEIKPLLALQYPEVSTATVRTRVEDGYEVVEFLPQPGRKG